MKWFLISLGLVLLVIFILACDYIAECVEDYRKNKTKWLLSRLFRTALLSVCSFLFKSNISAGLCIGLGSIGPLIGLSLFSQALCRSIGHNRDAYPSLFSFAIITQAFIEALLIFALLIALFIINTTGVYETISTQTIQIMASAACIGLGTLATGIASGYVSSITCQNIAQKPSFASLFSRTNMLAQIFIETSALYAALIAFFLVKL